MSDDGPVTLSRKDWHAIWDKTDLINEAVSSLEDIEEACETLGFTRAVATLVNIQADVARLRADITKILLLSDERMGGISPTANEQMEARS